MRHALRRISIELLAFFACVFASVPSAAQAASFSREVAPILALNCHACHGANPESVAGGLSTRTWRDLKKGSNLGRVIVPGNPSRSPLYQFVSGARGEATQMPLGGPPLTLEQTETIRKWILDGAAEDADTSPIYRIGLPSVRLERPTPVRFAARIPVTAYVELELVDSRGRSLYREGGAVKKAREPAGIGVIGEWIVWNLRRGSDWPEHLRALLTVRYAAPEPENAVLVVGAGEPQFYEGESEIQIVAMSGNRTVAKLRGTPSLDHWKRELTPGWYTMHSKDNRGNEGAVLFRAGTSR